MDSAILEKAKSLIKNRQYQPAISLLKDQMKANPDIAELRTLLEEAQASMMLQMQINQKIQKIRNLISENKNDAAQKILQEILKIDPTNPEALSLLPTPEDSAMTMVMDGNIVSSIHEGEGEEVVKPESFDINGLGEPESSILSSEDEGNEVESQESEDFKEQGVKGDETVLSQPSSKGLSSVESAKITEYLNDGKRYISEERYQDAIDLLSRVFILDEDNVEATSLIEEARSKMESKDASVDFALQEGIAAFNSNDYIRARTMLNKVIEVFPNHREALLYLSKIPKEEKVKPSALPSDEFELESSSQKEGSGGVDFGDFSERIEENHGIAGEKEQLEVSGNGEMLQEIPDDVEKEDAKIKYEIPTLGKSFEMPPLEREVKEPPPSQEGEKIIYVGGYNPVTENTTPVETTPVTPPIQQSTTFPSIALRKIKKTAPLNLNLALYVGGGLIVVIIIIILILQFVGRGSSNKRIALPPPPPPSAFSQEKPLSTPPSKEQPPAQPSLTSGELYALAMKAKGEGNLQDAERYLKSAIAQSPSDEKIQKALSDVSQKIATIKKEEEEKAAFMEQFKRAVTNFEGGQNEDCLRILWRITFFDENSVSTTKKYGKMDESNNMFQNAYYNWAINELRSGNALSAVDKLNEILRKFPNNSEANKLLKFAQSYRGKSPDQAYWEAVSRLHFMGVTIKEESL